jgi:hypothetical protein
MAGLARSYIDAGQFVEGTTLHEETLNLRRIKEGHDHPNTVQSMTQLGDAWERANNCIKAEPLRREVLHITREQFGAGHFKVASALRHLGRNLVKQGKSVDAEQPLREALSINEALGADDWEAAQIRCLLGEALLGQQKYSEAETLLLKGHEGLMRHQEKIPESSRQQLPAEAIEGITKLYEAWGKADLAIQWRSELRPVPDGELNNRPHK